MQRWAKFIIRTRWFWIIAWPIAAVAIWWPAPSIPTLLRDDATGFLPSDEQSERAFALLRREFPNHSPASSAAIVFRREQGLSEADRDEISRIAGELQTRAAELEWNVLSAASSPWLRELLESPDGRAAVINIDLPAGLLTHSTVNRVREVQKIVQAARFERGLEAHVTGGGALGELLDRNAKKDIDRTTLWTFVGVAVILLLVYRSLVGLALPIVTIACSLLLSLGLLGWAASFGLPINGLLELLVVVVLVGSGVDYCLFLFGRFLEVRSSGGDVIHAVETALSHTGGAVLASAGTNVAGFSVLILARHRDLYTSGPVIAFTLIVAAFSVLTLAPALMVVVGGLLTKRRLSGENKELDKAVRVGNGDRRRNTLGRKKLSDRSMDVQFWSTIARLVTRQPGHVAAVVLLVLIPFGWIGATTKPLYDTFEEYPADSSFVRGADLYARHFFDREQVGEMTLLVTCAGFASTDAGEANTRTLDRVANSLAARFPVLYQRDLADPLGTNRRIISSGATIATDESAFFENGASEKAGLLSQLGSRIEQEAVRKYYVGQSGTTLRIDLGLAVEPRSTAAMELLPKIRDIVANEFASDSQGGGPVDVLIGGDTAIYADIRALRARDFRVIAVASIVLIFLILLAMTRSALQSGILIAATLITYLASYGLTWLLFHYGWGVAGLNWQVNFFLFIVILSLGQDYNIFVVSRIREEVMKVVAPGGRGRKSLVGDHTSEAVGRAIRQTGGVVSGCGLVMAATFGSMFSGSLLLMKEMAVAIAVGILVDTFVIRPLFVPAMILLVARRATNSAGDLVEQGAFHTGTAAPDTNRAVEKSGLRQSIKRPVDVESAVIEPALRR